MLVVAIGAFLTLSLLPLFAGRGDRTRIPSSAEQATAPDARAELEARAKGYELVLEREPDNLTALQGLVDARIQLGDLAGVVEPLEKFADLNPNVPEYRVLLGQTKQGLGDLEGAADAYRTVLAQRPGDMNALQGLVALLIEQKRPQAAIGLLQDTLKAAPKTNEITPGAIDVSSVQLLLAQVYVEENRTDQALKIYDEAIATAPEDFRPILAKALVLRDLERAPEAAVLFQKAEALAPDQFKDQVRQLANEGTASQDPATPSPSDNSESPASQPLEAIPNQEGNSP